MPSQTHKNNIWPNIWEPHNRPSWHIKLTTVVRVHKHLSLHHLRVMALCNLPLKVLVKESKCLRSTRVWELCQGTEGTGGSEYERRKAKNARNKISFTDFLKFDQICLSCMAHFIFPLSISFPDYTFTYHATLSEEIILGTGTKDQLKYGPCHRVPLETWPGF